MRSICPTCETAYTIPDDRIGPKGRKVRCTKCGDEWRVTLAEAEPEPTPAPEPVEAPPPRAAAPAPKPEPVDAFDALDETEQAPPPAADAPAPPRADAAPVAEPPAAPLHPALPPQIRMRPKRRMPTFRLPQVPLALSRATPFIGPLVFVSACLTLVALVVFRTAIVAAAPDLAGLYAAAGLKVNLRGLAFERIETLREVENGQAVLVIEGAITNTTKVPRDVPAVRLALRDADNQELYAWAIEPKAAAVAPGDSVRFRTRLAAPPDQATDVQVRFIERRNHQAGL